MYTKTYPYNLIIDIYNGGRDAIKRAHTTCTDSLAREINKLSKTQQQFIHLRYKENRPRRYCAEALGMTMGEAQSFEINLLHTLANPHVRKQYEASLVTNVYAVQSQHNAIIQENNMLKLLLKNIIVGNIDIQDIELVDIPVTDAPTHDSSEQGDIIIENLKLSGRTYNALRRAGLESLYDIKNLTEQQVMQLQGVGVSVMTEIIDMLETHNLQLQKVGDTPPSDNQKAQPQHNPSESDVQSFINSKTKDKKLKINVAESPRLAMSIR